MSQGKTMALASTSALFSDCLLRVSSSLPTKFDPFPIQNYYFNHHKHTQRNVGWHGGNPDSQNTLLCPNIMRHAAPHPKTKTHPPDGRSGLAPPHHSTVVRKPRAKANQTTNSCAPPLLSHQNQSKYLNANRIVWLRGLFIVMASRGVLDRYVSVRLEIRREEKIGRSVSQSVSSSLGARTS